MIAAKINKKLKQILKSHIIRDSYKSLRINKKHIIYNSYITRLSQKLLSISSYCKITNRANSSSFIF